MARGAIIFESVDRHETFFKEFLIIEQKEKPVGVLDLHLNCPDAGICNLKLFLLQESVFGQELFRRCYQLAEDYVKWNNNRHSIRVGTFDSDRLRKLWDDLGFKETGRAYGLAGIAKKYASEELEKNLND